MVHMCNPSIWDPEAGGAGVLSKPGTHRDYISNQERGGRGGKTEGTGGTRRGERLLNLDLSF